MGDSEPARDNPAPVQTDMGGVVSFFSNPDANLDPEGLAPEPETDLNPNSRLCGGLTLSQALNRTLNIRSEEQPVGITTDGLPVERGAALCPGVCVGCAQTMSLNGERREIVFLADKSTQAGRSRVKKKKEKCGVSPGQPGPEARLTPHPQLVSGLLPQVRERRVDEGIWKRMSSEEKEAILLERKRWKAEKKAGDY